MHQLSSDNNKWSDSENESENLYSHKKVMIHGEEVRYNIHCLNNNNNNNNNS